MAANKHSGIDTDLALTIVLGQWYDTYLHTDTVSVNTHAKPKAFLPKIGLGVDVIFHQEDGKAQEIPTPDFAAREILNTTGLTTNEIELNAWRLFQTMARNLAPKLYEHDPRIGMFRNKSFPRCLLFDPTYLDNSTTYEVYFKAHKSFPKEHRSLSVCPLCEVPFSAGPNDVVYWGGGNLAFVHSHCAPWILEDKKTRLTNLLKRLTESKQSVLSQLLQLSQPPWTDVHLFRSDVQLAEAYIEYIAQTRPKALPTDAVVALILIKMLEHALPNHHTLRDQTKHLYTLLGQSGRSK